MSNNQEILLYIVSINIVTFLTYGFDKYAAIKRMWRVPEKNLHLLMFAGGTLGAIWGQKFFRHKTQKKSFRSKFYVLILIQAGIALYIMSK